VVEGAEKGAEISRFHHLALGNDQIRQVLVPSVTLGAVAGIELNGGESCVIAQANVCGTFVLAETVGSRQYEGAEPPGARSQMQPELSLGSRTQRPRITPDPA
jgi:hypothetical protein